MWWGLLYTLDNPATCSVEENKKPSSSRDEIANVNFLYDDIVHALENTIVSCINSAADRFLQRKFTEFSEITQCNVARGRNCCV